MSKIFRYKGHVVEVVFNGPSMYYQGELDYSLKIDGELQRWNYSERERAELHAKQLIDAHTDEENK